MSTFQKVHSPKNKVIFPNSNTLNRKFSHQGHHSQALIQRAQTNPHSLTSADALALQKTLGNRAVCQLMKDTVFNNTVQRTGEENKESPLHKKSDSILFSKAEEIPVQRKNENKTGLPVTLKDGVENLSGFSMDDVRVHYNSDKPPKVGALAYTHGTDIFLAYGQEKYLPHEAWHVVQQAEGRVKPTLQMSGMSVNVNDDAGLENEADMMGGSASFKQDTKFRAHKYKKIKNESINQAHNKFQNSSGIVQKKKRKVIIPTSADKKIQQWNFENGNVIVLTKLSDELWKLVLTDKDGVFLGHISIFYSIEKNQLKPDGLEVPGIKQGSGYGAILGKYAVKAMSIISQQIHATSIYLNLVNPISAHISIKELDLNMNGGQDKQDDEAVRFANQAVKETEKTSKLYQKDNYPGFWGRLVYLAKNNNVEFLSCLGNYDKNYQFGLDEAKNMLAFVLASKSGTFGLDIRAPLPRQLDTM